MQQQFVALGMGVGRALRQPLAQQCIAALEVAFGHLEAAELGAGVRITRPLQQFSFHRLAQPLRLVALGQQLRPVAVMEQRRFGAVGDAPVVLLLEQFGHAVVHHRVVGAAPADRRVAPEQAAHIGVGRLHRAALVAQQVDQQHIRLGHQGPQRRHGFWPQALIGVEHQHPVAAHPLQGLVAGRGEVARPVDPLHPRPHRLGKGHGVVGGAGVHHHHLVHEALHRAQAVFDLRRFVAHDHREAEHGGVASGLRLVAEPGGLQSVKPPSRAAALRPKASSTTAWACGIWPGL